MFKNQLQELAQRSCYNMPSYSCIKEGPDHAPSFKAAVNFNGEIFESPGYFATLRHAEHAAAEIALKDLQNRSAPHSSASQVLGESGVCKNLLQENAQRAGVPLPVYNTRKSGPGHQPVFTCTVEVAAMQFSGEPAKTKKQAEKNAALAAWGALRKKAGRRSTAPVEDSDVTDEQEQKLISDILKNNLSEKQPIKSSPAALAENQHHRAGVSPALLPSAPLYTRRPTEPNSSSSIAGANMVAPSAAASGGGGGPLYTRRGVQEEAGATGGAPAGGPMYKPRHISANWVRPQGGGGEPSPVSASARRQMPQTIEEKRHEVSRGGDMYALRQTHSSPLVHSQAEDLMQPRYSVDAHRANHSSPIFPTQQLVSHGVPPMHGLGIPRSSQVLQPPTGTTSHTNLAIRPGMAYQPRSMRGQGQHSFNAAPGGGSLGVGSHGGGSHSSHSPHGPHSSHGPHSASMSGAGMEPQWSQAAQLALMGMQGNGIMGPNSWAGPSPASNWNPGMPRVTRGAPPQAAPGMQLCVGVPAVMATGVRGNGVLSSGVRGNGLAPSAVQDEEEDVPDSQQAEHTTRLMLNHLCLE